VQQVGGFRVLRVVEEGDGYRYLVGVREAGKWLELIQVYYPGADQESRYNDEVFEAIKARGQS